MATATIVSVWISEDDSKVFITATVDEVPPIGLIEYVASVTHDAAFDALTDPQKKTALLTAITAVRDPRIAAQVAMPEISGTGTV